MRQVYETPTPQRKIKSDTLPQSFTLTAEHVRGLHLSDLRIVGARGEEITLHDAE